MRKLTTLLLIFLIFNSCKKESKNAYQLPITIAVSGRPSNTSISMEVDQNGTRILTVADGKPSDTTPYATSNVTTGDVIKVHYSSNLPFNGTTAQGSANVTFKWGSQTLSSVSGDLGGTTGKTITFTVPEYRD